MKNKIIKFKDVRDIPKCSTCNGIKELEEKENKEIDKIYKEFNIIIYDVYPADQYKLNTLVKEIIRLRKRK